MNLAAKSAVMNTLRRTSKQVIPQTQPVSIAVHQPPVPVGPTVATKGTSTRGMSMVDQIKYKVRER
jgi:hypothetical protein